MAAGQLSNERATDSPFLGTLILMKEISIKDLKARLSSTVAAAESGATIIVTRHNQPVAQLGPPQSHVHDRRRGVSGSRLRPAIKGGTKGRYLAVLMEDRGNR